MIRVPQIEHEEAAERHAAVLGLLLAPERGSEDSSKFQVTEREMTSDQNEPGNVSIRLVQGASVL